MYSEFMRKQHLGAACAALDSTEPRNGFVVDIEDNIRFSGHLAFTRYTHSRFVSLLFNLCCLS